MQPAAAHGAAHTGSSGRSSTGQQIKSARVLATGREQPEVTASPTQQSSQRQYEPYVTHWHVSNALSKTLSSKLYGAHHLRQQAAIVARRQQRLDAANITAAQLLTNQKELRARSAELRQQMATVQVDEHAAVVRLRHEADRLDADLDRVQAMKSGLTHLLQSQSAKLEHARGSVANAEASRPQPSLNTDSAQVDTTLPGQHRLRLSAPVQIASSADAWSVQLAVQDLVDATAEKEETQRAFARHSRRETWIQHANSKLAQLQEQLADERRKPRARVNYDVCARLRNDIADLTQKLDQRRCDPGQSRLLEKLDFDEDLEELSLCRPQRRLVALLDGTFGLPVDDEVLASALTPFDAVRVVANPVNESKVVVRQGPSVQHLLFGETYSTRWETVKGMVLGLVERAIETALAHKPSGENSARPAVWEWRDCAGRRAWHQFDSNLSHRLEERYVQLQHELPERQGMPAADPEARVSAEIRWTEPAEDGATAAFIIDLGRMLLYRERDEVMDGTPSNHALSCATLVRELVAPQPIVTFGQSRDRQRVLHPLVRGVARDIRRRDPVGDTSNWEVHRKASGTARLTFGEVDSPHLTALSTGREPRSADAIEQLMVRKMMHEAEKLGRRDRALPVGTRLWVESIG